MNSLRETKIFKEIENWQNKIYEEAKEEAKKEAKKEAKEEAKKEIAKKLLQQGMHIDKVAEITDLNIDVIISLSSAITGE